MAQPGRSYVLPRLSRGASLYQEVSPPTSGSGSLTASVVVTLPGSLAVGNFLVVAITTDGTNISAAPAGWSLVSGGNNTTTGVRQLVYTRVVDGTETATYTWTLAGAASFGWACYPLTDAVAVDVAGFATSGGVGGTTATAPSVSPTNAGDQLLSIVSTSALTAESVTPPGDFTELVEVTGTLVTGVEMAVKTVAVSGATGTVVSTLGLSANWVAAQIALRSSAAVVAAVLDAPLGALMATITATPDHPATMAAPLGGLSATITATPDAVPVLAAPLGGLTAAITATPDHPATLAAPLGGLTATITATVEVPAVLAAPLGSLIAAIAATPDPSPVLAAPLGALTATATFVVSHQAVLDAQLGGLVAAISVGIETTATLQAPLGELTARLIGPPVPAVFSVALGVLTAHAYASVISGSVIDASGPIARATASGTVAVISASGAVAVTTTSGSVAPTVTAGT